MTRDLDFFLLGGCWGSWHAINGFPVRPIKHVQLGA